MRWRRSARCRRHVQARQHGWPGHDRGSRRTVVGRRARHLRQIEASARRGGCGPAGHGCTRRRSSGEAGGLRRGWWWWRRQCDVGFDRRLCWRCNGHGAGLVAPLAMARLQKVRAAVRGCRRLCRGLGGRQRHARMCGGINRHARIIAADIGGAGKTPQTGRGSLLCRRQLPHEAQIGADRGGQIGRHRRMHHADRIITAPSNCQHENMRTPRGAILPLQQRQQHPVGAASVATDGQADRLPTNGFVTHGLIAAVGQHFAVLRHGCGVVADQVVGQAPVEREGHRIGSGLFRFGIPPQRFDRIIEVQPRTGNRRLYRRVGRRNLVGARKKAQRRLVVAQRNRGIARFEQRIGIARVFGQSAQCGVERLACARCSRFDHRMRHADRGFFIVRRRRRRGMGQRRAQQCGGEECRSDQNGFAVRETNHCPLP